MDTPILNLLMPYLNYKEQADLLKIKEKIKALILVSKSLIPIKSKFDPISISSITIIDVDNELATLRLYIT